MTSAIEVRSTLEQHQIRLRLRIVLQVNRVLHSQEPPTFPSLGEMVDQVFRGAAVEWTDGGHINDFSIKQLDSRIRVEDACLSHPITLFCSEPMLCEHCHTATLPNQTGICKFSFAAA